MTDKELLELAAKAVGIKITWLMDQPYNTTGMHPAQNIYSAQIWSPLTNDGDAFRLAIDLSLIWDIRLDEEEVKNPDIHDAIRRSIVRAAAEIGRHK